MLNYNKRPIKYYHGTSTALNIKDRLKPATITNNLRETRKKNQSVVFLTNSIKSAEKYAKLAVNKYGGKPIIYECLPDKYSLIKLHNAEFICDFARIINKV